MCVVLPHHLGKGVAAHPRCIPRALGTTVQHVRAIETSRRFIPANGAPFDLVRQTSICAPIRTSISLLIGV